MLTQTTDCRIFQDKTVPEIIKQIFGDLGFSDFKDELTATYTKWDYCVQYRESDFNFMSRLMEHEGSAISSSTMKERPHARSRRRRDAFKPCPDAEPSQLHSRGGNRRRKDGVLVGAVAGIP